MSRVLVSLDYPAPKYHMPYILIYYMAMLFQIIAYLLSPLITIKSTFSPMRVALAGTYHYYSCERAKKDMGYKPVVSLSEAIQRTTEHFSYLRNKQPAS